MTDRPTLRLDPSLDPSADDLPRPVPTCDTVTTLGLPLYNARELTAGGTQALIRLGDATYMLRITRAGKLILTK